MGRQAARRGQGRQEGQFRYDQVGGHLEGAVARGWQAVLHESPESTREALQKLGVSVPAFPAYSPDLNPIEQAIAKLKAHLRKLAPRSPQSLTAALRDGLQQFTSAECAAFLRHSGYGQPKRASL